MVVSIPKARRKDGYAINVGGEVYVPSRFNVYAEIEVDVTQQDDTARHSVPDYRVELRCSTESGRDVSVARVEVEGVGGEVTGAVLREIPVTRLAKWGLRLIARERTGSGEWRPVIPESSRGRPPGRRGVINLREVEDELVEHLEKTFGAAKRERAGGPSTRDEKWWHVIETAYLDAIENRKSTIDTVHQAVGVYYSRGYVKNLISEARGLGYDLPRRPRVT